MLSLSLNNMKEKAADAAAFFYIIRVGFVQRRKIDMGIFIEEDNLYLV